MPHSRAYDEAARLVVTKLLPPEELTHLQAARNAIRRDATLVPKALANALPWQCLTWTQSGTATIQNAINGMRILPQQSQLQRLDVTSATAPTGANITARLWNVTTAAEIDRVNVVAGNRTGASGESVVLDAGTTLSVDILAVGSTVAGTDVTAQLWYVPVLE